MNFFDHKDLGNHLLQLCPKVVKHPVYNKYSQFLDVFIQTLQIYFTLHLPVCHLQQITILSSLSSDRQFNYNALNISANKHTHDTHQSEEYMLVSGKLCYKQLCSLPLDR